MSTQDLSDSLWFAFHLAIQTYLLQLESFCPVRQFTYQGQINTSEAPNVLINPLLIHIFYILMQVQFVPSEAFPATPVLNDNFILGPL